MHHGHTQESYPKNLRRKGQLTQSYSSLTCLRENSNSQTESRRACPELAEQGRLRLARHGPGFPVELGGINEPHAAFRKESRIRRPV